MRWLGPVSSLCSDRVVTRAGEVELQSWGEMLSPEVCCGLWAPEWLFPANPVPYSLPSVLRLELQCFPHPDAGSVVGSEPCS